MGLKPFQPDRTDLLINTDWGTDQAAITRDEAVSRELVLFKERWVTKKEYVKLKDEYHAYHSISMLAKLMTCLSVLALALILFNFASTPAAGKGGGTATFLTGAVILIASIISGVGLMKYRLWARHLASAVFAASLIFPFFCSDDKGALPFFWGIAMIGFYYLYRKTALRIFGK